MLLSKGTYTFPKGTDIIIAPHMLTHNPKLFPEPLEFRPERFSENESAEQLAFFSYFPFSAGPRNCKFILFPTRLLGNWIFFHNISGIGQKYAILEMKALFTKVLRHFEMSLAEDSQDFPSLVGEMILISENKIYFHLKPRLY